MTKSKVIKGVVICWVLSIGGIFIYGIITAKTEDAEILHLKKVSTATTFVTERLDPDFLILPVATGRLGAFYSCLKQYRYTRYSSKPGDGKEERVILKLQDNTRLDIRINRMEAYGFTLRLYDENNLRYVGSDIYGINCDMELLNKPDSDMYCEDKLLGNEIRPVCTYRPQQPPSQDDAKG